MKGCYYPIFSEVDTHRIQCHETAKKHVQLESEAFSDSCRIVGDYGKLLGKTGEGELNLRGEPESWICIYLTFG